MHFIDPDSTLADIVTARPELARELERRSLDYCCGGTRTLDVACRAVDLDPIQTANELAAVTTAPPERWTGFGPVGLVDHLEATHHAYLHTELPRLAALATKVADVHGANHNELAGVRDTLAGLRAELEPHLAKEERVLFPMIRELAQAASAPAFHCGSLQNPISVMLREHDRAGELLEQLRRLTGSYAVPADGCASYRALYRALEALEADTHLHVHKENNCLFPMVVDLEARLADPFVEGSR